MGKIPTLLELIDLSFHFRDGSFGLRNINLKINVGDFLLIAGANGSGKTTLCRLLNGLIRATEGQVLLDGRSIYKDLRSTRQTVGLIFQNADHQIVGETVAADVAFGPENLRLPNKEVTESQKGALMSVGLMDKKDASPFSLSGGEKRKLTIAGVLAMKPGLLVMDEPFANLDFPGIKQVLERIISLQREGMTIVMITHDLESVIALANRLVILNNGLIVRDGLPLDHLNDLETFGVREPCFSKLGQQPQSWLS